MLTAVAPLTGVNYFFLRRQLEFPFPATDVKAFGGASPGGEARARLEYSLIASNSFSIVPGGSSVNLVRGSHYGIPGGR